jgi:hypothetical protein
MIQKSGGTLKVPDWPRLLGIALFVVMLVPAALWVIALAVVFIGWMVGEPTLIRSVE